MGILLSLFVALFIKFANWWDSSDKRRRIGYLGSKKSKISQYQKLRDKARFNHKYPTGDARLMVSLLREVLGTYFYQANRNKFSFPFTKEEKENKGTLLVSEADISDANDLLSTLSISLEDEDELPAYWDRGLRDAIWAINRIHENFEKYKYLSVPLLEGMVSEKVAGADIKLLSYILQAKKNGALLISPLHFAWGSIFDCLIGKGEKAWDFPWHSDHGQEAIDRMNAVIIDKIVDPPPYEEEEEETENKEG
jgi:hypothetical protein